MNKYLISEVTVLRQIKSLQHRAQIIPLVLFGILFWCSLVFPRPLVFQILSVLSIGWYFGIASSYRLRQKIVQPDEVSVYCPVSGKINSIKVSEGIRQITIHKGYLDPVELRCPKTGCYWDGDDLLLDKPRLRFSFDAHRLIRIPEAEMKSGQVIALIPGTAVCNIRLPEHIPTLAKVNSDCEAGESRVTLPETALD
jgi:hypothetical protein